MSESPSLDIDSILGMFKDAGGSDANKTGGGFDMMQFFMLQQQMDRADRAESRRTMMQLCSVALPLLVPVLFKKDADPVMMTLLQGLLTKNNDGEQFKQMLQMMAAGNQMTMEQLKTGLLGVMELKDAQTKRLLEEASERGDDGPSDGPAGIMREIRLGLSALGSLSLGSEPAAPAVEHASAPVLSPPAAPAVPGKNPSPAHAPAPVPVVILKRLALIQSGKVKASPAEWSALATVALQDNALLAALDQCSEDEEAGTVDFSPLTDYLQPFVLGTPVVKAWIVQPGVLAWLDKVVRTKLVPMIDAARDEDEDDPAAMAHTPKQVEPTNGLHPLPDPEELNAANTAGE